MQTHDQQYRLTTYPITQSSPMEDRDQLRQREERFDLSLPRSNLTNP